MRLTGKRKHHLDYGKTRERLAEILEELLGFRVHPLDLVRCFDTSAQADQPRFRVQVPNMPELHSYSTMAECVKFGVSLDGDNQIEANC